MIKELNPTVRKERETNIICIINSLGIRIVRLKRISKSSVLSQMKDPLLNSVSPLNEQINNTKKKKKKKKCSFFCCFGEKESESE